jgi:VCBS repeat-containing protein
VGRVDGSVDVTDADSDALSYSASAPGKGAVTVNADGSFIYTPTAGARHTAAREGGPDSALTDAFTITVNDGHGGTLTVPVAVLVSPSNGGPTGTTTAGAPDANGRVTGAVQVSDPDSDTLTYAVSAPERGTVTVNPDGSFAYTPTATARHAAAADGAPASAVTDAFTVTVTDGHGGNVDVPVTVAIAPANVIPTGSLRLDEPRLGGMLSGTVQASDADADTLGYTASTPTNGTVTVYPDGTFTYVPDRGKSPLGDTFTIAVSDGYGGTIDVPVTVAAADPPALGGLGVGGGGQTVLGYGASSISGTAVAAVAVTLADIGDIGEFGAAEAAPAAAAETAPAATAEGAAPAAAATNKAMKTRMPGIGAATCFFPT